MVVDYGVQLGHVGTNYINDELNWCMLRFATPLLVILYFAAAVLVAALPDIRTPLHGVNFEENLEFVFARVYWSELLSSYAITKIIMLFILSLCFSIFQNRWVKGILFILLTWVAVTSQLKHLEIQTTTILSDYQMLFDHGKAVDIGYPIASLYDYAVSATFSILLVLCLILNLSQLVNAFKAKSEK